ncbi:restriction endonuclease subunit S [Basfia succiniciproducens]|uniref:restriction endonuclease subunit S n=1 Tax=Basfia succiniciproducens TaxID=653940 RepID=UPI0008AEB13A|nr:restriction endonuclease subunit S [Basfia succiniciproducens]SEQ70878.1 type I restriction enzyme, S subunit [Basfia succiniciproducens]
MKQNTIMQQLGLAKVEWKTLGEVAVIKTGQTVSKQKISDNQGIYPVINSGREPLGYIDEWNTENDPIGITTRGAGVGSITWQEGKYFRGNLNYSVTIKEPNKLDVRFLFHLLLHFQNELHSLCTFTGIPALNASELKKLRLPIPDINIQKNIVKTLDKLTELEATLEATLEAENALRIKQYHYYRNLLLTFDDNHPFVGAEFISAQTSPDIQQRADIKSAPTVVWKKLGEVANVIDSLHQTPRYSENGKSMIRVTDIKGGLLDLSNTLKVDDEIFTLFTKKYLPKKNDIVMSRVGSYGNIAIVPETASICMGQNTVVINPLINSKFLYYILTSEHVKNFIEKNVGGGSQKTLSLKAIKLIPIPIIDGEQQNIIADILDKFDRLTNSITEGLPKEIELRRKQYEYYREKLLTFA